MVGILEERGEIEGERGKGSQRGRERQRAISPVRSGVVVNPEEGV
jgi:hypothetical protein